ncbi:uncharacterized protein LAESUDRAFT_803250, partial [Laetiporus sulphureus 93-53]
MSNSIKLSLGSNRLYDIPFLEDDGANYQQWKFRLETVLRIRKLWNITQGKEARPADSESDKQAEWDDKDQDAKAQITLTLKDTPLSGIMYEKTAKSV